MQFSTFQTFALAAFVFALPSLAAPIPGTQESQWHQYGARSSLSTREPTPINFGSLFHLAHEGVEVLEKGGHIAKKVASGADKVNNGIQATQGAVDSAKSLGTSSDGQQHSLGTGLEHLFHIKDAAQRQQAQS